MTTMDINKIRCHLCGEFSDQICINSTNSFGSPDLDTRPAEMERSTINYWVQRCPSCRYSATSLSTGSDAQREIVKSDEYRRIVNNIEYSEVANSFLAASFIQYQLHQYSDAAWNAIQAAWVCDDEKHQIGAIECRKKAITMVEKAGEKSQEIADQLGASETITIDLMRRAGLFAQALKLAETAKKIEGIEEVINQIINYEIELIKSKDIDLHITSEALAEEYG